MAILKLPNEGDTYTGHVSGCVVEKGKYGEQVKFTFANQDLLFLPKVSADRQLLRAGFDMGGTPPQVNYSAVAGNTICFRRDPNPNAPDKPYWSVEIATGAAPAQSKRLQGPTSVPGDTPDRYKAKPLSAPIGASDDPGPPEPQDYPVRAVSGNVAQPRGNWAQLVAQVRAAYEAAVEIQGKRASADSLQAMAATLVIQADKRGIVIETITREQVADVLDLEDTPF